MFLIIGGFTCLDSRLGLSPHFWKCMEKNLSVLSLVRYKLLIKIRLIMSILISEVFVNDSYTLNLFKCFWNSFFNLNIFSDDQLSIVENDYTELFGVVYLYNQII